MRALILVVLFSILSCATASVSSEAEASTVARVVARVEDCDGLDDTAFIACAESLIARLEEIENAKVKVKLLSEEDVGEPGILCRSDYVRRKYQVCRYDLCQDVTPPIYYDPSFCSVWGERAGLVALSFFVGWFAGSSR